LNSEQNSSIASFKKLQPTNFLYFSCIFLSFLILKVF